MTFLNNGEVFSDLDIKGWLVGWKGDLQGSFFLILKKVTDLNHLLFLCVSFFFGKNFQWRGDVVAIFFPRPNLKGRRVKPSFS